MSDRHPQETFKTGLEKSMGIVPTGSAKLHIVGINWSGHEVVSAIKNECQN